MKNILRLLKYAKQYRKYIVISMIALVTFSVSQLSAPMIVRELVSLVTNQDPQLASKALEYAVILAFMYLIQAVSQYYRNYYSHYAAWHFVSDMRIKVYNHLQKLSLRYYHDKQTGQLMSRASNDVNLLETLIAHAVPDLIISVLMLVGVSILLFSINAILAALSLITVPFLVVAMGSFAKKVQPKFKHAQQALAEFNATLHDNLSGIKEIQAFNQQKKESGRVKDTSETHTDAILSALRLSAVYHPYIQFFNNLGNVLVIGFGGYLASKGQVPVEDIVAFIMLLGLFYQPIGTLGRINEDLQNALAGADRMFEILDTETDVKEKPDAFELPKVKGDICIDDVSFQYIDGVDVLKDINLDIKAGEMVALVGPTGVGKTTLVSLISRFYDPESGRITIDGHDLKDVSLKSLRENISIVLQDVFLFNGTVAENIAYGVPEAAMDDIIKAAEVAHANEFIDHMENGYDTIIGERGIKLSGGQKQRLSIARAVLRNTPIIILDEATASVDMETEKLIHEAIDRATKDRTTIIIAHRLSSIKKADKIVVLNEGGIEEIGKHNELMTRSGLYNKLCTIQFGGDQEAV